MQFYKTTYIETCNMKQIINIVALYNNFLPPIISTTATLHAVFNGLLEHIVPARLAQ